MLQHLVKILLAESGQYNLKDYDSYKNVSQALSCFSQVNMCRHKYKNLAALQQMYCWQAYELH